MSTDSQMFTFERLASKPPRLCQKVLHKIVKFLNRKMFHHWIFQQNLNFLDCILHSTPHITPYLNASVNDNNRIKDNNTVMWQQYSCWITTTSCETKNDNWILRRELIFHTFVENIRIISAISVSIFLNFFFFFGPYRIFLHCFRANASKIRRYKDLGFSQKSTPPDKRL